MKFWLLDISSEVLNNAPEIHLWGLDNNNRRVLLISRNFLPYFYLTIKANADPNVIFASIKNSAQALNFVTMVELQDKDYFGKPVKAIKVTCKYPQAIEACSKTFAKIPEIEHRLEDDIRYTHQYLIANDVFPCSWHEVEVEEIQNTIHAYVDAVYLVKSVPKALLKEEKLPNLRVLAFSTIPYSPQGSPRPHKNPIVIISTVTSAEEKQFIAHDSDDKDAITSFIKYVQDYDPDIIVGYGSNQQDWPFFVERAKILNMKISVDRYYTEPHASVYGHISITGRANIDFFDFAEDLDKVKVKTLENVADYLGVMDIEKRTLIDSMEIPKFWEDPQKHHILLKYSIENTRSIFRISKVMLDFAIQLSKLVGLPIDHVGAAAVGFRVEWYLIHYAIKLNELIPTRSERPYIPYEGGIVLTPSAGMHENIAVLDFKSMYPNIMKANNISPDTYVPEDEPDPQGGVYLTPELNYRFRKEPLGFYKHALSDLISARDEVKVRLKGLSPTSSSYRLLDARQQALKVITNACYGYAGWVGARWYVRNVAQATTAWGRYVITSAITLAKQAGIEVIYGDTDSIFVKYEPEKIQHFLGTVSKELSLEIKPDEIYSRILFTSAKKRYAALLPDGRIDIIGLEVARGDWSSVARGVQKDVIKALLEEKQLDTALKKAINLVHVYLKRLKNKEVLYKDLIIWKTLTKPLEEYAVKAPHSEAAKILQEKGYDLTIGDKIGFVILKGKGPLHQRAMPYNFASYDDLDLDYYIKNQILPTTLRVLEDFGVKEEDLVQSS